MLHSSNITHNCLIMNTSKCNVWFNTRQNSCRKWLFNSSSYSILDDGYILCNVRIVTIEQQYCCLCTYPEVIFENPEKIFYCLRPAMCTCARFLPGAGPPRPRPLTNTGHVQHILVESPLPRVSVSSPQLNISRIIPGWCVTV